MSMVDFETPQAAEAAFYDAFERGDLVAMMAAWLDDEGIVCIHPMSPRLQGREPIEEGWRQVLAGSPPMRFVLTDPVYRTGPGISVHSLFEDIHFGANFEEHSRVIVTNVYVETDQGWRMVEHHGSPAVAIVPATGSSTAAIH